MKLAGVLETVVYCTTADEDATRAFYRDVLKGVEIVNETTWDSGLRSFYFEDPAGNMLEIAEGDMWPNG